MSGMLVSQKRPRVLNWFHAGPLLYGDWGTSRLYVLGLAFFYTAHASAYYLGAMAVLMAAVAWAYTIICRCFPDGGGVYTAARQISPMLAVIGATLLLCDYIVTAAISIVDGMHYLGVPLSLVFTLSSGALAAIGVLNWFGAKQAGRFALLIALCALGMSLVIAVLAIPAFGHGLKTISWHTGQTGGFGQRWESFVQIVLALSGVEAVANMTGLMKEPVARTAKKTIWPVLIEVVVLNAIFGIALSGLPSLIGMHTPDAVTYAGVENLPENVSRYTDTAMRVLATETGGRGVGLGAAIVYGLLLLSAGNTAIMAIVAVLYSMAHDRELPSAFTRLNYPGVPWVGLIAACIAPLLVLLVFGSEVKTLAELYAVGVCGAITISILSCAWNRRLAIRGWERACLAVIGLVIFAIEATIVADKPHARYFALVLVAGVLAARYLVHLRRGAVPAPFPELRIGWLAEVRREPVSLDPGKPRIMLAARGRHQAEFAVDLAKKRGATLFAMYVRTLRVIDITPGAIPRVEDDPNALEALGSAAVLAREQGVPFVPIYVTSTDIADEILDYTVTFACDTLILGKSRRRAFWRKVEGDVVAKVAANLPPEVSLILRGPEADTGPEKAGPTNPGGGSGVSDGGEPRAGENGGEQRGRDGDSTGADRPAPPSVGQGTPRV